MSRGSPLRIAASVVGGMGMAAAIGVAFVQMRAVMGVGGLCASGGPYQIRVQCPPNTEWLLPLSIVAGVIFFLLFLLGSTDAARPFSILAWTALFV